MGVYSLVSPPLPLAAVAWGLAGTRRLGTGRSTNWFVVLLCRTGLRLQFSAKYSLSVVATHMQLVDNHMQFSWLFCMRFHPHVHVYIDPVLMTRLLTMVAVIAE